VKRAIRFSYLLLDGLFRRMIDDGFSSEKAIIVLGCAQVAAAFTLVNALILGGNDLPLFRFGFGVALMLGLLIVYGNYRAVYADRNRATDKQAYEQMSPTKKICGGILILLLAASLVIAAIITSSMVAKYTAGRI
jgi:hypothetical protein